MALIVLRVNVNNFETPAHWQDGPKNQPEKKSKSV